MLLALYAILHAEGLTLEPGYTLMGHLESKTAGKIRLERKLEELKGTYSTHKRAIYLLWLLEWDFTIYSRLFDQITSIRPREYRKPRRLRGLHGRNEQER